MDDELTGTMEQETQTPDPGGEAASQRSVAVEIGGGRVDRNWRREE
jgi:hypothetical protein